ncbi:MAG: nucleotidyltransferase family protein [Chloroflexi bacterium]|nr:nucleotidyltransferase family protein [Chloroflexota bacterium]
MQPLRDTTATPVGRSGDSPSTALILAAGAGTRLLPITNELPKVLVPVHGIPLLVHILRWLADQGVSHVVVNSHHRAEHLAAFLRSVRSPRISLLFEPRLLGSGGTLKALHSFIDTDCYVVYGDVLSNADLRHLSRIHSHSVADVTCLLHAVPDPWNKGVAVTDSSGWITSPADGGSNRTHRCAHPQ